MHHGGKRRTGQQGRGGAASIRSEAARRRPLLPLRRPGRLRSSGDPAGRDHAKRGGGGAGRAVGLAGQRQEQRDDAFQHHPLPVDLRVPVRNFVSTTTA